MRKLFVFNSLSAGYFVWKFRPAYIVKALAFHLLQTSNHFLLQIFTIYLVEHVEQVEHERLSINDVYNNVNYELKNLNM